MKNQIIELQNKLETTQSSQQQKNINTFKEYNFDEPFGSVPVEQNYQSDNLFAWESNSNNNNNNNNQNQNQTDREERVLQAVNHNN